MFFLPDRPTIQRNGVFRRVAAGENDSAEMKCMANGYPDVTFAWSFNGSNHLDSQKYTVRQSRKLTEMWWSSLFINTISQADYGVYTCIAENHLGHDFITFSLVKKSKLFFLNSYLF